MRKFILMAIKPYYAQKIKKREKKIELRRTPPKASKGDIIVIYESRPVQMVTAYCEIASIISSSPEQLWKIAKKQACIDKTDYEVYFSGKEKAYGIVIDNVVIMETPKRLDEFLEDKHIPQNFFYISSSEFDHLLK